MAVRRMVFPMELSSDMKTVKIRTSSFSTFELQATRGEDTSIDDTTVTPEQAE